MQKTKESMNIYDVSVLTALAIMVATMGFIAADGFETGQNSVGLAAYSNKMVCISNTYGEIVCSTISVNANADSSLLYSCFTNKGCVLTCAELETDCGSSSTACDLKERFC